MGQECGEEVLVAKAATGDPEAMVSLLEAYYDRIYRMAWHWCGAVEAAQDIAQEVCVKLTTSIRSYRGDSAFATWVWRITYNASVDYNRSAKRFALTEPTQMMALVDGPSSATPEDGMIEHDLWQEVHGLPPQQRDAVLLVYAQDMSHADAAGVMGCTEKTVSWHLHEARKALKTRLEAAE